MSNPYSTLKAAWHLDRIKMIRHGLQCPPVEVQLILSDLCNHDCHFCAYRATNGLSVEGFGEMVDGKLNHNPNRMIEEAKAKEIILDAETIGVKSIIFTGGGEPTVHPQHLEMFKLAMDHGMDASLNTNGNLFREGWQDVLPRMSYVRFSVDAGNPEEYAAVRRVGVNVYEKVIRNLTDLVAEVKRRGSDCVVGAGYVVTPENYRNAVEGVSRLKDCGVEYVRIASMQSTDGYSVYGDELFNVREALKETETLSGNGFRVVNLFDGVMGVRPDYDFCGFQQFVTYIGADLGVYRCCYTAYTDHGRIGNLKDQSFHQWFYSPEKERNIAEFSAKSCDTCPLNDKNKTILYMADPKPLHVNFV